MAVEIKKKNIQRGIRLFLLLTIIGTAIIFYVTGSKQTWLALQKFQMRYFFFACLLILVDLFSGALRIHIFTRKIVPGNSFQACFQANLANIFLAAATPFQTGGGVAQLYVLNRNGVPYAAGLTISILNFVATLSMLFVAASIILTRLPQHFGSHSSLFVIMDISRFAFYFTLIIFLLFMVRPGIFERIVQAILSRLGRFLPKHKSRLSVLGDKVIGFIQQYQGYLRYYWRNGKMTLVLNYILTIILYFNKCLIAYVIFRGLGVDAGFWEVVMLQMLIVFFLYFAPTPGASLIAETSTTAVMSIVAPAYVLTIFTVLWRFFTTYFGVILGSFVLLRAVGKPAPVIEQAKVSIND